MKFTYIHGDITRGIYGAIVNAANPTLLGGGGVDGAIHRAVGPKLREYCKTLPEISPGVRCPVGGVVVTSAGGLSCLYVFHTVGPIFPAGRDPCFHGEQVSTNPKVELAKCIQGCLVSAERLGVKTIAFPAISCGVYGCPISVFAKVFWDVLRERDWNLQEVTLVLFEEVDYRMFEVTWGMLTTQKLEVEDPDPADFPGDEFDLF